jgi:hypothetical protein
MSAIDEFLDFEAERKGEMAKEAVDPFMVLTAPAAAGAISGGWRQGTKDIVKGMASVAAASALVGGVQEGIGKLYNTAANAVTRAHGYKKMLKHNPQLQKMDRKRVEQTYRTLHKFNPEMASDPLVASSFVKRVAEMGAVAPADIAQLAGARDRSKTPPFHERAAQLYGRASLDAARHMTGPERDIALSKARMGQQLGMEMSDEAMDLAYQRSFAQQAGKNMADDAAAASRDEAARGGAEQVWQRMTGGKGKGLGGK